MGTVHGYAGRGPSSHLGQPEPEAACAHMPRRAPCLQVGAWKLDMPAQKQQQTHAGTHPQLGTHLLRRSAPASAPSSVPSSMPCRLAAHHAGQTWTAAWLQAQHGGLFVPTGKHLLPVRGGRAVTESCRCATSRACDSGRCTNVVRPAGADWRVAMYTHPACRQWWAAHGWQEGMEACWRRAWHLQGAASHASEPHGTRAARAARTTPAPARTLAAGAPHQWRCCAPGPPPPPDHTAS